MNFMLLASLVLWIYTHFSYVDCGVYDFDRDALAKEVVKMKKDLAEKIAKLIVYDSATKVTLYPQSCLDIRRQCSVELPSGLYKIYNVKDVEMSKYGFSLKPNEIPCSFDLDDSTKNIDCFLPSQADQKSLRLPTDCKDIQNMYRGMAVSREYSIYNMKWSKKTKLGLKLNPKKVYCDMDLLGGGWTLIHRRENGNVDFNRNWKEYASGFGDVDGDHWLGNKALSSITALTDYELRIEMTEAESRMKHVASYQHFKVANEKKLFQLSLSLWDDVGFIGNTNDSLSYQNGMFFSTYDNDNSQSTYNCADVYRGGWWFKSCTTSNLNGVYADNSHRTIWWQKPDKQLLNAKMMIRPRFNMT